MSESKHFTLLAATAFGVATLMHKAASAAPIQAPVVPMRSPPITALNGLGLRLAAISPFLAA